MEQAKKDFLIKRVVVRSTVMILFFAIFMAFTKNNETFTLKAFDNSVFVDSLLLGLAVFPLANLLTGLVVWNLKKRTQNNEVN